MYEERRNTLSFRDIILQLMLVILFVFVMIWLFPTKNYLKDNFVGKDELTSEIAMQLQSLYGRLYTDNVESMRDAAQGYFTNERLPGRKLQAHSRRASCCMRYKPAVQTCLKNIKITCQI